MSSKNKISDLLKNGSFLKWLKKGRQNDTTHWETWAQEKEENAQLTKDARAMMDGIPFKKMKITDQQTEDSWNNLVDRLDQKKSLTVTSASSRQLWVKLAAAVTFLIIAAYGVNIFKNQKELLSVQTTYGETKVIPLPEGSEIILGPNSSLSYYDNLAEMSVRSVSLKGEAFFKIATQGNGKSFEVQTKDISVTVIGTIFNINSHRLQSIVSLVEGQVNLQSATQVVQVLKPTQTAFFNIATNQFEFLENQTDYWSSWTFQQWNFGERTSFHELKTRIEETYGLQVIVENKELLSRSISGAVSISSQSILFESLAALLDINFIVDGQQVIITDSIQ